MKKSNVCQFHKINDCIGQKVSNHAWEKAWKAGKAKPSRDDFNKDWTKLAGKKNPYKGNIPKYDKERGSSRKLEKLLKEVLD